MKKIDMRTVLITALVTAIFLAVVRAASARLPDPLGRIAAYL